MAAATIDLVHIAAAEAAALQRFVALLERERKVLIKGEVDRLFDIVREKNDLAVQLALLSTQRGSVLAADGLAPDRSGMAAWFAAHPAASDAQGVWSSLLSLASEARELNRDNGNLIQLRLQHNAQALEALLGANASLKLYGPDGQSTPASGHRISDCA